MSKKPKIAPSSATFLVGGIEIGVDYYYNGIARAVYSIDGQPNGTALGPRDSAVLRHIAWLIDQAEMASPIERGEE